MGEMVTCTMCGYRFDPTAHMACRSCPLQRSCQLTCCPVCGFEMVNPERSILARLVKRVLSPEKETYIPDSSQRN